MPEYRASYRKCRNASSIKNRLKTNDDITIKDENTGGWYIITSIETALELSCNTRLTIRRLDR